MQQIKKRTYKSVDAFFDSIMKGLEVRIHYEEERAKTKIAMAVKSARKLARLTQAQLAKKVGITQSVIACIESGADERTPSLPLLSRIAAACNGILEFGFKFKKAI